ncbi:AEC family transporter [Crenobacter caeni]|uniref:AEC family transporter n=1 Tax=Crenobacter caeni TaxID=2705474 RepID=A0A6B2KQ93_9NEIS|nr:AEC family transporter [Crenobacter caeni]NDV12263.1 AEC family transporter [Crenobacter caeni]
MLDRIVATILPVIVIVAIGWWYGRTVKPDMRALNRVNMDVCVPLLVFSALADRGFDLAAQWRLVPAATLVILVSGLIAWPVARALGVNARTLLPAAMFNNSGNMGLPLALLAFGPEGFAGFVVLFVISNLLHFTLGAYIFSPRTRIAGLARNPIVIASALGVAASLLDLHPPAPMLTGLKMLGDATIPLMLFALGVRMVSVGRAALGAGVIGALACPIGGLIGAYIALWLIDLPPAQAQLLILFGALPPAVLNFLMAEHYRQEPERMAAMVLVGNLASIAFVPLGLALAL